jgi:hypothetical protein
LQTLSSSGMHIPHQKWAYKVYSKLLKATKLRLMTVVCNNESVVVVLYPQEVFFCCQRLRLPPPVDGCRITLRRTEQKYRSKSKGGRFFCRTPAFVCTIVLLSYSLFPVLAAAAYREDAGFIWICYIGI